MLMAGKGQPKGYVPWNKGIHTGQTPWNKGKRCDYLAGEKNSNWKGGVTYHTEGYRLLREPTHPFADCHGYVPEHRLIYERHYNCILPPWVHIHHKNENKTDNRIKNLEPLPRGKHTIRHRKGVPRSEQTKTKLRLHHNSKSNLIGRGPYRKRDSAA